MSTREQTVLSLAAVVSQLELALRESRSPVQQLGEAIGNISAGLGPKPDVPQLQREVGRCLESLQFYDRLTQHLSHLLDFMSDMTAMVDSQIEGEEDEAAWSELQMRLRRRLISDQQRELLDLVLPRAPGVAAVSRVAYEQHADLGSIELF